VFDGFEEFDTETSGTRIHGVRGGSGPPVLLLHGIPETHLMWHRVAPTLAEHYTVVATDLRGYGDSGEPPSTPDHEPYSMRAIAHDQLEVMRSLGFDRFRVAGHDRGARCAYRRSTAVLVAANQHRHSAPVRASWDLTSAAVTPPPPVPVQRSNRRPVVMPAGRFPEAARERR